MADNNDSWAKWVAGLAGVILTAWMGFISVTQIRMDRNLVELKTEVSWIKNEANTVINHRIQVDATQDNRLVNLENEIRQCRERLIRTEVQHSHGSRSMKGMSSMK